MHTKVRPQKYYRTFFYQFLRSLCSTLKKRSISLIAAGHGNRHGTGTVSRKTSLSLEISRSTKLGPSPSPGFYGTQPELVPVPNFGWSPGPIPGSGICQISVLARIPQISHLSPSPEYYHESRSQITRTAGSRGPVPDADSWSGMLC